MNMKSIVERICLPALLEQTAEECTELAHACLKESRRMRGENPTPCTEEECKAGYTLSFAAVSAKLDRWRQRLDEAGK